MDPNTTTAPVCAVQRPVSWAASCLLIPLLAAGCQNPKGAGSGAPSAASEQAALKARAEQRWDAIIQGDIDRMYDSQDPNYRRAVSREEYARQQKEQGGFFKFLEVQIERIEVLGDLGWVELHQKTALTRFPDNPPQQTHRWEKWRRMQGAWYACTPDESKNLPNPPSERNLDEETALEARVRAACAARLSDDIAQMAPFINPADRDKLPVGPDAHQNEPFKIVDWHLEWVEATERGGRARIVYTAKSSDPNQSKLPPVGLPMIETWVKVDGVWYRDLPDGMPTAPRS